MKPHHFLIGMLLGMIGKIWADDPPKLPLIVISQIVEHEALTKEREGIIQGLKDAGFENGKTATILYENAQGNIATAAQIAVNFASQQPEVAIGISTPSAQSLAQPMAKCGTPLVFTAVTDPVSARLVSTLDAHRPENVTGVSDGIPLQTLLELIQKLTPSVKTLGILYSDGEMNSVKAVEELKILGPKMGFSLAFATTSKTAETLMAATSLIAKAQAIFIPLDNTAMASITGIVGLGKANGAPIFTPDYDSVEQGVLAVRAPSHRTMGYKAGQLAARILKGEKASDLPVTTDHPMELAINKTSADALGINIPEDMKQSAHLIN